MFFAIETTARTLDMAGYRWNSPSNALYQSVYFVFSFVAHFTANYNGNPFGFLWFGRFFYRLDLKLFGFLSDFQILNLNTSNPSTLYQLYVLIASSPQIGFSTFIRSFYFSRIFRMDFITKLYQFPLKSPFGKKISLLFCSWNSLIVFLNPTLTNHLHTDLLARCCLLIYHIYTVYGSWSEWIT